MNIIGIEMSTTVTSLQHRVISDPIFVNISSVQSSNPTQATYYFPIFSAFKFTT
jgi:hypothetical protein